jgi:hypothetical protein
VYESRILRSGVVHIKRVGDIGGIWVKHDDPALLRWMGENGYSTINEIPVAEDLRDGTTCEVCGAEDVEVHHWLPKEWVGATEADRWPVGDLCRPCHAKWHRAAELAAARLTARLLRGKGWWRTAQSIEEAVEIAEEEEDTDRGLPPAYSSTPIIE